MIYNIICTQILSPFRSLLWKYLIGGVVVGLLGARMYPLKRSLKSFFRSIIISGSSSTFKEHDVFRIRIDHQQL